MLVLSKMDVEAFEIGLHLPVPEVARYLAAHLTTARIRKKKVAAFVPGVQLLRCWAEGAWPSFRDILEERPHLEASCLVMALEIAGRETKNLYGIGREDLKKFDNVSGALAVGMTTFGGSLWLLSPSGFKAHFTSERQAAAALLVFFVSVLLAGFPAGWLAGGSFSKTPLPVWLAMAGAYLVPAVAWFAGSEPAWPACLAWAWALPFAGSWTGLGLAGVLERLLKKKNTSSRA